MPRRPAVLVLVGVAVLAAVAGACPPRAASVGAEGVIRGAGAPGAVPDAYIVVLADGGDASVDAAAAAYAGRYGGEVTGTFSDAVRGFTVRASASAARRLAAASGVSYVEQDRTVSLAAAPVEPVWGLDRIDQRHRPLSEAYVRPSGAGVTAYVLDTGVRISHRDFGGRARYGYDFVDNDAVANDCNGHGTHVAGTVGAATYGVVNDVKVVSVRVLNCKGTGTYSQIIAGVNWVTRHAVKPAVANMSLGGSTTPALDTAVRNSIASGVTYVVAAGNTRTDACATSPARTPAAITVGATDRRDARASFSNFGPCLDLFAPGVEILSTYRTNDRAAAWMSGTSMAAPHVTGAAALYLARRPDASPAQVREALVSAATRGVVTDARRGSPDALLHTGPLTAIAPAAARTTRTARTTR